MWILVHRRASLWARRKRQYDHIVVDWHTFDNFRFLRRTESAWVHNDSSKQSHTTHTKRTIRSLFQYTIYTFVCRPYMQSPSKCPSEGHSSFDPNTKTQSVSRRITHRVGILSSWCTNLHASASPLSDERSEWDVKSFPNTQVAHCLVIALVYSHRDKMPYRCIQTERLLEWNCTTTSSHMNVRKEDILDVTSSPWGSLAHSTCGCCVEYHLHFSISIQSEFDWIWMR